MRTSRPSAVSGSGAASCRCQWSRQVASRRRRALLCAAPVLGAIPPRLAEQPRQQRVEPCLHGRVHRRGIGLEPHAAAIQRRILDDAPGPLEALTGERAADELRILGMQVDADARVRRRQHAEALAQHPDHLSRLVMQLAANELAHGGGDQHAELFRQRVAEHVVGRGHGIQQRCQPLCLPTHLVHTLCPALRQPGREPLLPCLCLDLGEAGRGERQAGAGGRAIAPGVGHRGRLPALERHVRHTLPRPGRRARPRPRRRAAGRWRECPSAPPRPPTAAPGPWPAGLRAASRWRASTCS
jgi:hypothetical protein